MKFVTPARASARALLVAVFGGALFSAGLVGAWSETRDDRPPPPAPSAAAAVQTFAEPTPREVASTSADRPSPAAAFEAQAPARLILASDARPAVMTPFQLDASGAAQDRALDCLTTAVYYEARGEGTDGMAAVAQVVLNRVRHPAFPKSVCGVVFQGCQFSFACGGMNGRRNAALWSRSREIAEAAIAGAVMQRVGASTHFHATRINPRWSGLSRVATIGRHVFYSFSGRRGAPSTFLNVGGAGEAPARAQTVRPEAPIYAMLPSEQADAVDPVVAVQASAPPIVSMEPVAAPEVPAEPVATTTAVSGPTPLLNAPVTPADPMATASPIA